MSEAAWKAEKERIALRNDAAQKAGKKERETQERERESGAALPEAAATTPRSSARADP